MGSNDTALAPLLQIVQLVRVNYTPAPLHNSMKRRGERSKRSHWNGGAELAWLVARQREWRVCVFCQIKTKSKHGFNTKFISCNVFIYSVIRIGNFFIYLFILFCIKVHAFTFPQRTPKVHRYLVFSFSFFFCEVHNPYIIFDLLQRTTNITPNTTVWIWIYEKYTQRCILIFIAGLE